MQHPRYENPKTVLGGALFFILGGLFLYAVKSDWSRWFGLFTAILGVLALLLLLWQILHPAEEKDHLGDLPDDSAIDPPAPPRLLTPAEMAALRDTIAILHQAGILAPQAPAAEDLAAAVADEGAVDSESVLIAVMEAGYYHPGYQEERYSANLACIDTDCEQDSAALHALIDDLLRLAGDDRASYRLNCEADGDNTAIRLQLTSGGHTREIARNLPPHGLDEALCSAIARFLYDSGAPRRLIWTGAETLWLSSLPADEPQALARLNQALGLAEDDWNAWRYPDTENI
jgi:hypothetical protein